MDLTAQDPYQILGTGHDPGYDDQLYRVIPSRCYHQTEPHNYTNDTYYIWAATEQLFYESAAPFEDSECYGKSPEGLEIDFNSMIDLGDSTGDDIPKPVTIGEMPAIHTVNWFCESVQYSNSMTPMDNLVWFEKTLEDKTTLKTPIPCNASKESTTNNGPCAGLCLAGPSLGCRVQNCPLAGFRFQCEDQMRSHVEKHLRAPTPSIAQPSQYATSPAGYPTTTSPNLSWSQFSTFTPSHNAGSPVNTGTLTTNSPASTYRSRVELDIPDTENPSNTLEEHANVQIRHYTPSDQIPYPESHHSVSPGQKNPKTSTKPSRKKEKKTTEYLCIISSCTRSRKGFGFGRSDNLLNHLRGVHHDEVNIPNKLPKGRKKGNRVGK